MALSDFLQGLLSSRPAKAAVPQELKRPERVDLPQFLEMTPEIHAEIIEAGVEVLTGDEGRQIQISTQAKSYICVFADGTLVVSRSHRNHAIVFDVLTTMRRMGLRVKAAYSTSLEAIGQLYERSDRRVVTSADYERMQKDVLRLLEEACEMNATDIKIEVAGATARIRVCVNDRWRDLREMQPEIAHQFLASAYNLANVLDGTYKENEYQMARISAPGVPLPGNIESVRMQFGPVAGYGRFAVMRLLFSRFGSSSKKTVTDLGYDPEHLRTLKQIRDVPFGVVVWSGPTGSGKSTTLAVALERLYVEREGRINIVTVEDPPEYEIRGATQLPVANVLTEEERRLAFVTAFNAVLRMKPHVIMVGEVRDLPAAQLLFKASQSGHQVWTSIHCKSGIGIPVRLKEIGIDPYLVTDSSLLIGAAFQRLVPRLCDHCSLSYDPRKAGPDVDDMVRVVAMGDTSPVRMRNPKGCSHCVRGWSSDPGYTGQTVVAEVLQPTDEMLAATLNGKRGLATEIWLSDPLALTAFEHGLRKVMRGELDPRDVFEVVLDREGLTRLRDKPDRRAKVRNSDGMAGGYGIRVDEGDVNVPIIRERTNGRGLNIGRAVSNARGSGTAAQDDRFVGLR